MTSDSRLHLSAFVPLPIFAPSQAHTPSPTLSNDFPCRALVSTGQQMIYNIAILTTVDKKFSVSDRLVLIPPAASEGIDLLYMNQVP